MAVYERAYRAYAGPLTHGSARRTVITRYALADLLSRKLFIGWFVACLGAAVGFGIYLYVQNNLDLFSLIGVRGGEALSSPIGTGFFLKFLAVQGLVFAFLTTLFVGPGLIAPDLRNNALPLYFSRPLTRGEYLAGKGLVLALVLSLMTWIPGLLLWVFQAVLAGGRWWADNLRSAFALVAGSWILIAILTLLALAVSAVVKWKPLAGAVIFAVYIGGKPLSLAINGLIDTGWGSILDINHLVETVWSWLLGEATSREIGAIPPWAAVVALGLVGAACVAVLRRRIKAYEVVR